jgi:hypothetical protein
MGQVLGVEGPIRPHEQQVKLGLLPVAEKKILTDRHAQDFADGRALFHGVGRIAGHPVIVHTQLLQQGKGRLLLGKQLPLRPGIMA